MTMIKLPDGSFFNRDSVTRVVPISVTIEQTRGTTKKLLTMEQEAGMQTAVFMIGSESPMLLRCTPDEFITDALGANNGG